MRAVTGAYSHVQRGLPEEITCSPRRPVTDFLMRLASVSGVGEFHSNSGLGFDRLSRLVIRLKAPLLDGFTRGGKKSLWTTDYLEVLDVPIFVDSGQKYRRPFHRLLFRQ